MPSHECHAGVKIKIGPNVWSHRYFIAVRGPANHRRDRRDTVGTVWTPSGPSGHRLDTVETPSSAMKDRRENVEKELNEENFTASIMI